MATKKQKKGKTMALTDFLSADSKLVTVRANWSEIVDNADEEPKPIVVDIGVLPTAPRGAVDIDYSNVPNNPPFVAHVANISFEIDDEGLRRIFADLNPKTARVMKDGVRSRGNGLVEFETRDNLIEGLKRTDKEVYGRKIRISVSDKTDTHQTDGGRGTFGSHRSNRNTGGEDRSEMSGTWKRAEPRSDEPSDDRQSGGFNRDRNNRGDQGRSNMSGGSRGNQQGDDYGYGYPRTRDDRGGGGGGGGGGGSGGRDYNRQGQRNRYQDDDNRSNSGADRPRYAGRYSDTRDTRDRNRPTDETSADDQREPPRERQRLQLQPRTKPLEELQPLSGSSSSIDNVAANAEQSTTPNPDDSSSSITNTSNQQIQDSSIDEQQNNLSDEQSTIKPSGGAGASIFGGAKPVDTAARELEIEKKLQGLQVTNSETSGDSEEKKPPSRPSYNRGGERDVYRAKRSSHNDEYSGGRQTEDDGRKYNDDDHPPRRGGQDRDRYSDRPRRDQDSNRTNKYNNNPDRDNERNNNRNRNNDTNEFINPGRSSNTNTNPDSQLRQPQRGTVRRTVPTEDDTNKLQLSNKFGMLDADDDEVDDNNENDDAQSPSIDD